MASLGGLSASVTRILSLTGFNKELKTKDIQSAFSDWEGVSGGFKIKWRDDTSLLVVFNDASIAKRAYLHTLAYPPAILNSPTGAPAVIRPYDGADAQAVIQNVNSRGQHGHSASRAHNGRSASISVFPTSTSVPGNMNGRRNTNGSGNGNHVAIPEHPGKDHREPSPTLPSLPAHPTLNSLINEQLDTAINNNSGPGVDPAILATSLAEGAVGAPPKIGDPGKRIIGAALGVRHPGLPPRSIGGGAPDAMKDVQKAMGGLVVAE